MLLQDRMSNNSKEFGALSLPMKKLAGNNGGATSYRVYKNAKEFDIVPAETVTEAIEKSGIPVPFKIDRVMATNANIIESGALESVSR